MKRVFSKSEWNKAAVIGALAALALLRSSPCLFAQTEGKDSKPPAPVISLNSLSLEVGALQSLYDFNFSKSQLEKLQQLAGGAASKDQKRKAGKASKEYRDKLQALRKALVEAKDDVRILKLGDELATLRDKENPFFDDAVDTTELARKRAADAFRMLTVAQLASYIGHIAPDVLDPAQRVFEAMEDVRAFSDDEWKEERDGMVQDISRMAVGPDSAKAKSMSEQMTSFLTQVRSLSKADFQKQLPELKKSARKIVGNVAPLDVLRFQVEGDLAALLSNPRLPQAIRARVPAPKPVP